VAIGVFHKKRFLLKVFQRVVKAGADFFDVNLADFVPAYENDAAFARQLGSLRDLVVLRKPVPLRFFREPECQDLPNPFHFLMRFAVQASELHLLRDGTSQFLVHGEGHIGNWMWNPKLANNGTTGLQYFL